MGLMVEILYVAEKKKARKKHNCVYYNEDKTPPSPGYQHTEQSHNRKEEKERIRQDGNFFGQSSDTNSGISCSVLRHATHDAEQ